MMLPFSSSSFWVFSNSSFPWRQDTRTGLSQKPSQVWWGTVQGRQPPGGAASQAQAHTVATRLTVAGLFHFLPSQERAGHLRVARSSSLPPAPTPGITFKPFPLASGACSPIPDQPALAPADPPPGTLFPGHSAGTQVSAQRSSPAPSSHLLVLFTSPHPHLASSSLILQNAIS